MIRSTNSTITVRATIHAPAQKVWKFWTEPRHIISWNHASDDWHTLSAENDLRIGGRFSSRMEAKDGSWGFDFAGKYTKVDTHRQIDYMMDDGRTVSVLFESDGDSTHITQTFEAEETHTLEKQREGWQAILDNFKKHAERFKLLEPLHFEIEIDAPVEKVYFMMLDDRPYREWTAEFNPGSYYEGNWKKGSKIRFIGTDENGNFGGMAARIRENKPNSFVSIEHYGFISKGVEITKGPDVDKWAGAQENYTFIANGMKTLLAIDVETYLDYKDYFTETWPKALNKLKSMCESKN